MTEGTKKQHTTNKEMLNVQLEISLNDLRLDFRYFLFNHNAKVVR